MLAVTAPTVDTPTTLGFGAIGNTTLNRTLVVLTSALSLLGAIVIIITYYAWKDMQSTSRKILVYISGADCVVVSSFMFGAFLPPNTNSPACTAQSLLYTTANLCSIFWTTFMAVFLYISIARKKPKLADIMFYMFHAIGWVVPVLIACIALQAGVLGNDRDIYSSAWCWIKVHDSGKNVEDNYIMWMLVTGKAWEVLVFILILIFYGLLKCHLRQEVGDCQWRLSLITNWNTAIRVYFLHLMKLSDCVSHVILSVTTWSILLHHMTLENRGIETNNFQRCYELQRHVLSLRSFSFIFCILYNCYLLSYIYCDRRFPAHDWTRIQAVLSIIGVSRDRLLVHVHCTCSSDVTQYQRML